MSVRFCLFLIASFATAANAFAHNGHSVVADYVSGITVDGDLSDWPTSMKRNFMDTTIYVCDGRPRPKGFKGQYRVGWDRNENALYVAVEIEDDSIVLDPIGNEQWNSRDGCEVFVSMDHGAKKKLPSQFIYRGGPDAVFDNKLNSELAKAAKVARATDDTHLLYEWRIDLSKLVGGDVDLANGGVIGFDVAFLDRDSEELFAFYSSSSGHHKHTNSNELGDLVIPKQGAKFVRLAGNLAWKENNGLKRQIATARLQSVGNKAMFIQTPVYNGQFMGSFPTGEYDLSAAASDGHTVSESVRISLRDDVILDPISLTASKKKDESPIDLSHAVVYYDLAHGQQEQNAVARVVDAIGCKLEMGRDPIREETLAGKQMLYLLGPTTRFSDEEITAIIEFVRHGGSLLLAVDESRRASLSETQANDLIAPFGMKLTGDTEYVHNCGAVAKSGYIHQRDLEIPYSGGRAVKGGSPFAFQIDRDGNPSHPFAAFAKVGGGGRVIVMGEAMAALLLGTKDGERLSGTPRNYAQTNYWGKDSMDFNSDVFRWLLSGHDI